jgi:hypothetical protein
MGELEIFTRLYDILKERPDLFFVAAILLYALSERSERKTQQKKNGELVDKMHEQNIDTNELLGQIRFLLELLTKGRR